MVPGGGIRDMGRIQRHYEPWKLRWNHIRQEDLYPGVQQGVSRCPKPREDDVWG